MNHKKSMRIFWLSLCLLLLSGAIIITVVQIKSRKDEKGQQHTEESQSQGNLQTSDTQADMPGQEENSEHAASPDTSVYERTKSEDTAAQTQPTLGDPVAYLYELRVKNGYLEVYYYQTEQLFFHTGIPYHVLTTNQRKQLEEGKYFHNEQELYGYLESCTS